MTTTYEKIEFIRDFFDLSPTQLCKSLRMERFYIHENVSIPDENQLRLNLIYDLAQEFKNDFPVSVGSAHLHAVFVYDGINLYGALTRDNLYAIELRNMLWKIAHYTYDKVDMKYHIRLHWAEEFDRLGYEKKSFEEQQENLRDNLQRLRLKY